MAENTSLADRAVAVLAAVRAIDEGMDMEHPERHSVRSLKRAAESILSAAFEQAGHLAYLASDLTSMVNNVRLDEAKRALATEKE